MASAVSGSAAPQQSAFPPEQRGDANARFVAVWVKENPLSRRDAGVAAFRMLPSGEFQAAQETVRQLLVFSYQVEDYQVVDAPDWMAEVRFDIVAQAPDRFEMRQVRPMIRNLLADRFALIVSNESRTMPTYALEWIDRTHKPGRGLRSAPRCNDTTASTAGTSSERSCEPGYGWEGDGGLFGRQTPIKNLARLLMMGLHRPVIDKTGLRGLYDFNIGHSGMGPGSPLVPDGETHPIFAAIQEQLGLKLTTADDKVDVVAIKRVQRPTTER